MKKESSKPMRWSMSLSLPSTSSNSCAKSEKCTTVRRASCCWPLESVATSQRCKGLRRPSSCHSGSPADLFMFLRGPRVERMIRQRPDENQRVQRASRGAHDAIPAKSVLRRHGRQRLSWEQVMFSSFNRSATMIHMT